MKSERLREEHMAWYWETAHRVQEEIWKRFLYGPGIVLDYAGLDGSVDLPTEMDCAQGRINLLSWWTPIENGAFFNGVYLDALCREYLLRQDEQCRERAKKLTRGLMCLASAGQSKGFIARGIARDGKSVYPIGSDDQTAPWFSGLWHSLNSGIPDQVERDSIRSKMVEVADALLENNWNLPCNRMPETHGRFTEGHFRAAARLLFICKIMSRLTGDEKWEREYRIRLNEVPDGGNATRLELCRVGLQYDLCRSWEMGYHLWIYVDAQNALSELVGMETDPEVRDAFAEGVNRGAHAVMGLISRFGEYANDAGLLFDLDWRKMNALWQPQRTPADAMRIAQQQINAFEHTNLPQRKHEIRFMREPICACLIATTSRDKAYVREIEPLVRQCLLHYDYTRLYTSLFFLAENVCSRLAAQDSEEKEH